MVTVTLGVQIIAVDPLTTAQQNIQAQGGGLSLLCSNGVLMQDVALAASTSNLALAFPTGVTTATFIFIVALTTTDLVVKIGTAAAPMTVPQGQAVLLYGLTAAQVSLSSVLGGAVQYAVGG